MSERVSVDGDRLIVQRTHMIDVDRAARLREAPQQPLSDSWHVGSIPVPVVAMWLKEAGVKWDDTKAVEEVLNRKLMDGDFAKFRVKEGRI